MKSFVYSIIVLSIIMMLPSCIGPKTLKGKKIKSFIVKLENESRVCPNNPLNMKVNVVLGNGDIISTADTFGGIAWKDIIVKIKGATFTHNHTKSVIIPDFTLEPSKDKYLDLEVYSKYHNSQIVTKHIKLRYDCDYKLNLKGRKGPNASSPGSTGRRGEKGANVMAKVQLIKVNNKQFLQILVNINGMKEKKYLLSTIGGSFTINAIGGTGGNGANGRDASKRNGKYIGNGYRGGNAGIGGKGGNVKFIFSPEAFNYKNMFKANVNPGKYGRVGRGGNGIKNGRDGSRGESIQDMFSQRKGRLEYQTDNLPSKLW